MTIRATYGKPPGNFDRKRHAAKLQYEPSPYWKPIIKISSFSGGKSQAPSMSRRWRYFDLKVNTDPWAQFSNVEVYRIRKRVPRSRPLFRFALSLACSFITAHGAEESLLPSLPPSPSLRLTRTTIPLSLIILPSFPPSGGSEEIRRHFARFVENVDKIDRHHTT